MYVENLFANWAPRGSVSTGEDDMNGKRIETKISNLRLRLNHAVHEHGLTSPQAIDASQKLDRIINDYYKTRYGSGAKPG
jgi:hypothetical protein